MSMLRPSLTIAAYTLLEALRNRLSWMLLAAALSGLGLAGFARLVERLAGFAGLALFELHAQRREHAADHEPGNDQHHRHFDQAKSVLGSLHIIKAARAPHSSC